MTKNLDEIEFQRLWKRLQQVGLNAYESRAYLVLLGHTRFKALDLAARANVPRQKIYEVLDSLVDKGFAQVVQEKTKLFSAVEPGLAAPAYLARRQAALEREFQEQSSAAGLLVEELKSAYFEGREERGTLDYLRIVSEPSQSGVQFRSMLSGVKQEYLEFSRPPYAADPIEDGLVRQALTRGVACRLLFERSPLDESYRSRLNDYRAAGVEIRFADSLPMKLAVFDGRQGLIALLDPVVTKPAWTSVVFDHKGMGEAMKGLFEEHWRRGQALDSAAAQSSGL